MIKEIFPDLFRFQFSVFKNPIYSCFIRFKDSNIIDDATGKSLEMSNVSGLNGTYRCRVVNDYGKELSDTANLKVFGKYKTNHSCPKCRKHGLVTSSPDLAKGL